MGKYCQHNEEEILNRIFAKYNIKNGFLLDLGAGDGKTLSNTQLYLEQGWTGLRIDGNNHGNQEVKQEFLTVENLSKVLAKYNCPAEVDFASIDLDGNDYWFWLTLPMKPKVVCIEYNPALPPMQKWIMRYNPKHIWKNNDYYGYSYAAGLGLAEEKGYVLVDQNAINLFFVRKDLNATPNTNLTVPTERVSHHKHSGIKLEEGYIRL